MIRNLLHNGNGVWFVRCRWCMADVTSYTNDELAILAETKRRGWQVERREDGQHEVCCPRCAKVHASASAQTSTPRSQSKGVR